jgi:hypothetical protein
MKNVIFVIVMAAILLTLTSLSPHAGCVDQGQPIDCSLVANK